MPRIPLLLALLPCAVVLPAQGSAADELAAAYERARKDDIDAAVAEFVPRFQEAAEQRAGTEAAVPFLAWLVRNGLAGPAAGPAFDTLRDAHAQSLALGPVLDVVPELVPYLGDERCRAFLDKVLLGGSPPDLQARALVAHASLTLQKTKDVDDKELALAARGLENARKLTKDAALLARIARTSVERRGLEVGDVAPEIAGFDLDGAPLRLSDHRGKVVVVKFWGDWCGPCRAMLPHERGLVERLKDQPFALLGVNSDGDLRKLRPRLAAEKIGWPNFWNGAGGTRKGIIERHGIRAFPTIYVLDAKGVIRFTNKRDTALDAAVDQLLAEMAQHEAGAGK